MDQVITTQTYPEALKAALIHRRVTMVGNIKENVCQNSKIYRCDCCNKEIRKIQPVNFNINDIGFLGSGYTLYFMFNRMCQVLLTVILILFHLNRYICKYFEEQLTKLKLKQYEVLAILVVSLSLVLFRIFQVKMDQIPRMYDEQHVDPEDYSIWVKNLPIEFQNQKQIQDSIKQYFETQFSKKLSVASLCLCYNLIPLGRLLARKKQQLNKLKIYRVQKQRKQKLTNLLFNNTSDIQTQKSYKYHGVKTVGCPDVKTGCVQQFTKQKIDSINKFINYSYHKSAMMFIGEAFLSFETVQMRDIALKQSNEAYFYGNQLQIQKAVNPRDINWHNLHLQKQDIKLRRLFSFVSCIAIIFTTLSIRIFFAWIQLQIQDTKYESQLLKSSTSGIIIVMNIMIEDFFLKHLQHYEGHPTKVKNLTRFASKCIILQVLTCLVVPYLAAYFIFQMKQQETYVQKINDLIFGNALVALSLISISHKTIIKQLKIKLFELGGWRFIPKTTLTIRQLCLMYQLPEFQIQKRYSATIKNTMLTFCFFAIIPNTLIYTLIYLFFSFYVDKYNLVRRRCVLISIDQKMNKSLLKIFCLSIPMYLISEMIHNQQISKIMISLIIITLICLPKLIKLNSIQKKTDIANQMSFWEANSKFFHTDYRRQNPALVGIAQKQFEQKIQQFNQQMNANQKNTK